MDGASTGRKLRTAFDTLYGKIIGYEGVYPTSEARKAKSEFDAAMADLPGAGEAWRTDDCRAAGDRSSDPIEQLVHELSWELEEASLSASDYVTINREKLRTIAKRVLDRVNAAKEETAHG